MSQYNNAMEIFKILPKTNCKKCNDSTCLAFASNVFLGKKPLELCPFIPPEFIDDKKTSKNKESLVEQQQKENFLKLKEAIQSCNLKEAADRCGGIFENGRLTLRIFGKPFTIDSQCNLISDIHINPWIIGPVLNYVLNCKGVPLTGEWVPFRELDGGREKNGLFVQRSEKSFKQIADRYTGMFKDLIHIFNGKKTEQLFESDIALVLYPLPKLPVLICYWQPEEGMESDLHLFFDSSADENANIDIVYSLFAGIVVMFEKLSLRHSGKV